MGDVTERGIFKVVVWFRVIVELNEKKTSQVEAGEHFGVYDMGMGVGLVGHEGGGRCCFLRWR